MKTHSLLILAGLAISFGLPGFAQQKDAVDPKVEQQIRLLAAKYDEAINRRDAAAVAALYSQDGVWVTHDGTFHGRQAIEKGYAQLDFKSWQIGNYFTTVDRVIAVGNEVHSAGRWSCVHKRVRYARKRRRPLFMDDYQGGRFLENPQEHGERIWRHTVVETKPVRCT
jgi:uncharacterized protein (TIGR02246 family)